MDELEVDSRKNPVSFVRLRIGGCCDAKGSPNNRVNDTGLVPLVTSQFSGCDCRQSIAFFFGWSILSYSQMSSLHDLAARHRHPRLDRVLDPLQVELAVLRKIP